AGIFWMFAKKFLSRRITFDTFCAFDLWEHLLLGRLPDYIDSFVALAEEDALFFLPFRPLERIRSSENFSRWNLKKTGKNLWPDRPLTI
ncbi:MAG: hypothetical protein C0407_07590, partial [Desulfobacca sp.]|nr:hypothetical protein [Desulfobacca sp.]